MNRNEVIFIIGSVCVLVGALLGILDYLTQGTYFLGVGTVLLVVVRLILTPRPEEFRLRRLATMQFFSCVLLALGTFFMWKADNIWVVLLLLASVFEVIAAFRSPK